MSTDFAIHHDEDARVFETRQDGHRGILTYLLQSGDGGAVMTIDHTGVPPAARGKGMAAALVAAAFAEARRRGWRVRPSCSYAAVWAGRHPDVGDLLV
ncbi:GNAT family N-acetyltransferase [Dyella lutea]|uniref:N-acetyltransferase n=1 Tax=Dyella lutea TaxID=2950441 RepID=A0ABT1FE65_9GAMM|nr:GNAT family N-acetyltransferase [Dyella lutea]MCP1375609.1 N-acetyltransferase [Dyella lutea]